MNDNYSASQNQAPNTGAQQQVQYQQVQPQTQQAPVQYQQAPQNAPKGGFKKVILIILGIFIIISLVLIGFRLLAGGVGTVVDNTRPIEITWWGHWEDKSVIEPIIQEYQAQNPRVTITYQSQAKEGYRERLTNALARNAGPDIFRIHNTWVPMYVSNLSPLPESVMSKDEYQQTFYPAAFLSSYYNEQVLALPLMYDGLALFVNNRIFTTFAETNPTLWYELTDTATQLTIREARGGTITQSGIALGSTRNVDYWPEIVALLMIQNGASLTNPTVNDKGIIPLQYYKKFAEENIWNETLANSTQTFASGSLAMMFGTSEVAYELRRIAPSLSFKSIPVPQIPRADEEIEPDTTYASFWMEGVNAQSDESVEAWKFLKFVSSRENQEKLFNAMSASRTMLPELPARADLRDRFTADQYVGGIMRLAPTAKIWYLSSAYEKDEDNQDDGLPSALAAAFTETLNARNNRDFSSLGNSVQNILAKYGLARPIVIEE